MGIKGPINKLDRNESGVRHSDLPDACWMASITILIGIPGNLISAW